MGTAKESNEAWIEQIRQYVNGLQYGNVQIVVHDGKIVQIDVTQRNRVQSVIPGSSTHK